MRGSSVGDVLGRPGGWLTALLLAGGVAVASGCGEYDPLEGSRSSRYEDRGNALVLRYCAYDASSVPDLEDCIRRVSPREARTDEGDAGRYATGRTARCREGAGPYCGKVGP